MSLLLELQVLGLVALGGSSRGRAPWCSDGEGIGASFGLLLTSPGELEKEPEDSLFSLFFFYLSSYENDGS